MVDLVTIANTFYLGYVLLQHLDDNTSHHYRTMGSFGAVLLTPRVMKLARGHAKLGALVHLKVLDLSNNNLTGTLPSGWAPPLGSYEALQVFFARDNQISGTLPASLVANMTNLRYLMLQHNR